MSDANRTNVIYDRESTYGVAPTGSGIYTALRKTSFNFRQDTPTTASAEIRADRQIADLIRNGLGVTGEFGFEASFGAFDQFYESALFSGDFPGESLDIAVGTSVTFESASTAAGSYPRITRQAGDWNSDVSVGSILRIRSANNSANDGFVKVVSLVSTTVIEVKWMDFTDDATDTAAIVDVADEITNGTTLASYAFEAEYQDNTNDFAVWTGCVLDALSLNIAAEAIITGTTGWVGKQEASATSSKDSGTPIAAATNEVWNAIDNVAAIVEGGFGQSSGALGAAIDATEVSFSIANNIAPRPQIATLGPVSQRAGQFQVTGGFRGYYESTDQIDDYLSFASTALAFRTIDAAGNITVYDLPKVKFVSGSRAIPGVNEDVFADLTFEAVRDPGEDITMRIATFSAV
jgi:hypothetical protein